MADRAELIECFLDTREWARKDPALAEATMYMQSGTRLYLDRYTSVLRRQVHEAPTVRVVEDTTFSCARKLIGSGKTAVLNFANAYHPGGGVVRGAMAQEECLCRSSNLYEALTLPYILRHYYQWNGKNTGDMGSDRIIYSPGVTVFKSDDELPAVLDRSEWFRVDVLTCAAPYYDAGKARPVSREKLAQVFHDRIRNVLEAAVANRADNLILGAFGCGAFNNPPELVSEVFRELLVDGRYASHFDSVVFAIKKSRGICPNLTAFRRAFGA